MELCELNRYFRGYAKKIKEKQKENIALAWYTACFNNQKKIPSLVEILDSYDKPEKDSKEKQLKKIREIKEVQDGFISRNN